MVKAIFFDIDGTLISFKTHAMSEGTISALKKLREKNIKLFVATGRHIEEAGIVNKFFDFDGFITLNGQYCFNDKEVIHKKAIARRDLAEIIKIAEKNEFSFCFCHDKGMFANTYTEPLHEVMQRLGTEYPKLLPPENALDMEIYQVIAYLDRENENIVLDKADGVKSTRWTGNFTDLTPKDGGKDKGIEAVLNYYGLDVKSSMAFGDGENDLSMLKYVETGVAMGQAVEAVKASADYTTASVDEDGILKALTHFKIL